MKGAKRRFVSFCYASIKVQGVEDAIHLFNISDYNQKKNTIFQGVAELKRRLVD